MVGGGADSHHKVEMHLTDKSTALRSSLFRSKHTPTKTFFSKRIDGVKHISLGGAERGRHIHTYTNTHFEFAAEISVIFPRVAIHTLELVST